MCVSVCVVCVVLERGGAGRSLKKTGMVVVPCSPVPLFLYTIMYSVYVVCTVHIVLLCTVYTIMYSVYVVCTVYTLDCQAVWYVQVKRLGMLTSGN